MKPVKGKKPQRAGIITCAGGGSVLSTFLQVEPFYSGRDYIQLSDIDSGTRKNVASAKTLHISHPVLSLKTDNALAVARAALATIVQAKENEEIVLQIVLGPSFPPSSLPNKISDPHASWLNVLCGDIAPASAESRASIKEKLSYYKREAFLSPLLLQHPYRCRR